MRFKVWLESVGDERSFLISYLVEKSVNDLHVYADWLEEAGQLLGVWLRFRLQPRINPMEYVKYVSNYSAAQITQLASFDNKYTQSDVSEVKGGKYGLRPSATDNTKELEKEVRFNTYLIFGLKRNSSRTRWENPYLSTMIFAPNMKKFFTWKAGKPDYSGNEEEWFFEKKRHISFVETTNVNIEVLKSVVFTLAAERNHINTETSDIPDLRMAQAVARTNNWKVPE